MKHLMIDLETLSTRNNAAITAIGAVFFDPIHQLAGPEFYANIDLNDSIEKDFHICGKTIYWWLQQSDEAREALISGVRPVDEVLKKFVGWFKANGGTNKTRVWGNGATFDNVILDNAFDVCKIKRPWHYRMDRDIRTVGEFTGDMTLCSVPICTGKMVAHDALSDCKSQINWFVPMYRKLKGINDDRTNSIS